MARSRTNRTITTSLMRALPGRLGAIWTIPPDPGTLAPWAGFGVFCAYVAVAMAIAAVLLVRRDT